MADEFEECEEFIFFRPGCFYFVEIPPSQVQANVDLNPGTLMVTSVDGHIVWSPPFAQEGAVPHE